MKIVFIKKIFSFHGGAENYMKTLIDHLKDRADIHIMAKNWIETPGITFHKINHIALGSFLSAITFNLSVCHKIKSSEAGCIISFERTTCQDIYRAGDGCHREWLRLRAMIEPRWKRYTFLLNPLHLTLLRIEKKLFSNTKLIIANSKMVRAQIISRYGIPEGKIKVIYNGVDTKRFSPENIASYRSKVRKELSIGKNVPLILFVGSGFERKGLKTLIHAMSLISHSSIENYENVIPRFNRGIQKDMDSRLKTAGMTEKEEFKNIKLVVIGKGNITKFKSIARKYGINDRVLFLGPRTNIERFYAAADIFVLPTIYDPFSNATLEAMASGLPVITTRNNGASELIQDGEEGFIIENPLDYNILTEKIKHALVHHKTIGNKARLTVEKYPIEKSAEEFMKIISDFLS